MKMHYKKPSPELRTGMQAIPHTLRTKEVKDAKGDVIGTYQTVTMAYPEGHPMRKYRDKKKTMKAAKASN